jgi:hypothetical protein
MCFLNRLVLVTSLFVLLFLVKWFILYTSCILRGALRFQWDWLLLKKKKKNYILFIKKNSSIIASFSQPTKFLNHHFS